MFARWKREQLDSRGLISDLQYGQNALNFRSSRESKFQRNIEDCLSNSTSPASNDYAFTTRGPTPFHRKLNVTYEETNGLDDNVLDDVFEHPLLECIKDNVIGDNEEFEGPYGPRKVIYCDYVASGKPLQFIEDYIHDYVMPFYGNTHTTTSTVSLQTTKFREEARDIIKDSVNANSEDVVIFTGSGATSAIHKLIGAMEIQGEKAKQTVVIVGPFEHHSNLLPWMEAGCKTIRIRETKQGYIDMKHLEEELNQNSAEAGTLVAAFSAASNVTGILTDTVAVTELLHRYGAIVCWDYACGGPYMPINMNKSETAYFDAIFLSPHKFIGGPGSPGVLIAKKKLFKNPVPTQAGGGTVLFVTKDTHLYLKDIEAREEGGTPAIIESIRCGLAFKLKEVTGAELISAKEEELCRHAFDTWRENENLIILGSRHARRLPIFSFLIRHKQSGLFLHHNFVSLLLNDLYGIQARGGCACAGPYAEDLLGIDDTTTERFTYFLVDRKDDSGCCRAPLEIMKPGFTRINIPYFMDDKSLALILEAIDMVATHGWKLLPEYNYDPHTGSWDHRDFKKEGKVRTKHSLHDIDFRSLGRVQTTSNHEQTQSRKTYQPFQSIAENALNVLEMATVRLTQRIRTEGGLKECDLESELNAADRKMIWFLRPKEAMAYLFTQAPAKVVAEPKDQGKIRRTTMPFRPRRTSSVGNLNVSKLVTPRPLPFNIK